MQTIDNLDFESLALSLKSISSKVENILDVIKEEDYVKIGSDGDIWNGEAANMARETFDELLARFPEFMEIIDNYADYLTNNLAKR